MAGRTKPPKGKGDDRYRELWNVVDAAVAEAFQAHPNYLANAGHHANAARISVNKRVVGRLIELLDRAERS